jgi:hypothetical protein
MRAPGDANVIKLTRVRYKQTITSSKSLIQPRVALDEAKHKFVCPCRQSVPFLHMEHPERYETRSLSVF